MSILFLDLHSALVKRIFTAQVSNELHVPVLWEECPSKCARLRRVWHGGH